MISVFFLPRSGHLRVSQTYSESIRGPVCTSSIFPTRRGASGLDTWRDWTLLAAPAMHRFLINNTPRDTYVL